MGRGGCVHLSRAPSDLLVPGLEAPRLSQGPGSGSQGSR